MVSTREFVEFLIEAKRNTYAANAAPAESSRLLSKDLPYKRGRYYYLDSYFGDLDFIGQEVVWVDDQAFWGMNYYGEMLVPDIPDGFSHCLKEALKAIPFESPFRGPETFAYNDFEYNCNCSGDLKSFSGEESISLIGTKIYRLQFHGGFTKSFSR